MNPDFWHSRWEQNLIGFHRSTVNDALIEHVELLGIRSGDRAFVPLCGKSVDMLWLRAQGCEVIGVDLSPIAAAAFFDENGMAPEVTEEKNFTRYHSEGITILVGDFFAVRPAHLEGARIAYDRAALIALPEQARRRYAEHMAALLSEGSRMLLVSIEYPQEEMSGPPFSVATAEIVSVYEPAFAVKLLAERDVLEENTRFRERGITALTERLYLLERRA